MPIPRTVVMRSVALLRELSKEYGSTRTMEIWEQLAGLIDDGDLKMEVFKVMLTGGYAGTHIEVRGWDGEKKVTAIKALRLWTNAGLKEAKDAVDAAGQNHRTSFEIALRADANIDPEDIPYDKIVKHLEAVGLTIELV